MVSVVILPELFTDGFQFSLIGLKVHCRHRFEIGGVEARGQDCVLDRILDGYSAAFGHGGGRDHQLRFTILPM